MAVLNWAECAAVESIPGKVSGAWVFKNTRLPVSIVFENLKAGATLDEIAEWFRISRDQMDIVLSFAAKSLESPEAGIDQRRWLDGLPAMR